MGYKDNFSEFSSVSTNKTLKNKKNVNKVIVTKNQEWDASVMANIWRKRSVLDVADINKVKNLYDNAKQNHRYNTSVIDYSYCNSLAGSRGYGRLYSVQKGSFEKLEKTIRHSLCAKLHWDVDIVNCQPTLLVQLAAKYNVEMNNLSFYVDNRDYCIKKCMEYYNMTRDEVKNWIISCLFGCKIPELQGLQRELSIFMNAIRDDYNELYHLISQEKDYNIEGSFLSYVAQTEENKCLLAMNDFFENVCKRIVSALCYDGCMIHKKDGELMFPDELLRQCETYIEEKIGYKLKLSVKPMVISSDFMPKDSDMIPLIRDEVSDVYMADKFIKFMGSYIKHDSLQGIIVYDNTTGLWTDDEHIIRNKISSAELIEDTMEGIIDYSNFVIKQDLIIKTLPSRIPVENFINKAINMSTGKLLFMDGYYDMVAKQFISKFDPTIYFPFRIERKFPSERNETIISEVNKILFKDPYYDSEREVGEYLKKLIARGIAGFYEDKSVILAVGEPNSGKGVITNVLSYVFGNYIGTFNANALLLQKYNSTDSAKKMSWLLPIRFCRLIVSNEVSKGSVLDANLYKNIFSGGDPIMARSNYRDEVEIMNRSTGIFFCNDIPKFYPPDKGVCERTKIIEYKISFVDNPKTINQKPSDYTIKQKFATNVEYQNAFFWIIMDAFQNKVPSPGNISLTTAEEWMPDPGSSLLETLSNNGYIIDLDNDDDSNFTPFKDIKRVLEDAKAMNGMSDVKLGKELEKIGCTSFSKKINGITVKCRRFIKICDLIL
jgi:hypothetical protein